MGNLIRALAIALLALQGFYAQDLNVTKDKKNGQKSIELVMSSNAENPKSNEAKINRLIINSTYDDSIFISTFLQEGVNVTVVQDGKSVVDLKKVEPEKKFLETSSDHIASDVRIDDIEKRVSDLMKTPIDVSEKATVIGLLTEVEVLTKKYKDLNILRRLLIMKRLLKTRLYRIAENERRLVKLLKMLGQKLKKAKVQGKRIENLDREVAEIKSLAEKTQKPKLKKTARKYVKLYGRARRSDPSAQKKYWDLLKTIKYKLATAKKNGVRVENLDTEVEEMVNLAKKTRSSGFKSDAKNLAKSYSEARQIVYSVKTENSSLRLETIEKSLHDDYFVLANASVLIKYMDELVEFEKASPSNKTFVNLLKQEVANLTDSVKLIDTATNFLDFKANSMDQQMCKGLIRRLSVVIQDSHNNQIRENAGNLYGLLEMRIKEDSRNSWINILDRINATLHDKRGAGGLAGLKMLGDKLKFVMSKTTDKEVVNRAEKIMSSVEKLRNDINKVLETLDEISKSDRLPKNDAEVEEYEAAIDTSRKLSRKVNDPSVTIKAKEIANLIQKNIEAYQIARQISNANEVLQNMNRSLERGVETEGQLRKDVQQNINKMKRRLPDKAKDPLIVSEIKELLKVVNGYLHTVIPYMQDRLKELNINFEILEKLSNTDLSGLQDRIYIVVKDYHRIKKGLESVKSELKVFKFKDRIFDAVLQFRSIEDTMETLNELDNLLRDSETSKLVRQTIAIVHNIQNSNDTMKQLQNMITFNTSLMNEGEGPSTVPDPPRKVSINRPSLYPSIQEYGKASDDLYKDNMLDDEEETTGLNDEEEETSGLHDEEEAPQGPFDDHIRIPKIPGIPGPFGR